MKLAIAAFAFACSMSFGASAEPAVRGTKDAEPAVRKLEWESGTTRGDAEPTTAGTGNAIPIGAIPAEAMATKSYNPDDLSFPDDPLGDDIQEDHYYYPYQTGSCTCAKEAYLAVYKEAQNSLKMVPLVLPPVNSTESSIYGKIQREINRLVDFAVCFLHSIDCGCDDSKYGYKGRYKIINNYKVSTYQCCCDVHAVKDLIIKGIKDLAQWEMTMDPVTMETVVDTGLVHKRATYHVLENIVQKVYKNVREIGGLYIEDGEDCIDAMCADDSIYRPNIPVSPDDETEYSCGNTADGMILLKSINPAGTTECIRVCDETGKTICVINNSEKSYCDVDSDCYAANEICIPDSYGNGECVALCPPPSA